jgi:YjjG family noncanonical pyrimidine nucleotidase
MKQQMGKVIKAVLFDIDDTLFDRRAAQQHVFSEFRKKYAELFESANDYMLATVFYEADRLAGEYYFAGHASESIYEKRFDLFLTMMGLETDYAREMAEFYLNLYYEIGLQVDDAVTVVKQLAKKYELGVVSNGLTKTQHNKLKSLGLSDLFGCILISEEIGILKPEAKIFWQAAEKLGCQGDECLYVGNSYNGDVVGAKEAGMLACWFNPQKTHPAQMTIQPDYEIARLDELLEILK